MKPHLHIKLLKRKISSFHFFGVLGYIIGTLLGTFIAKPLGFRPEIVLLMAATGAGTFFLRAFFAKWITGEETIVYYHHEIAILVCCTLVLYLLNQPILSYLDITLLGIGTFLAFGRIGCFSVGCCHGRPHKHGVQYGEAHVQAGFTWFYKDVPLLPVQLIESGYVFLTVIAGTILLFNNVVPGTVLIVYTVLYGLFRFIMEYFRGDPDRPARLGVSEAQYTTLLLTGITYLLGKINWLPMYNWHGIILVLMVAATLVTI
ncbi:MAG: prolipoprotein diacylglyceryl transferase, partial [Dinghuibacter sp.]|nr:prolipoprotein diacylglyceryl transferase [Dinghuibacter sp.]